jgi:hypothetical protein
MPYTLNGCGTSYYGHRDPAEDGSYVTTLWVTFLWIPLLPLRSYRVLPVGKATNIIIHRSQNYRAVRVPLCWPQILNVYLCVSPILVLILYFAGPDIQKWWKEDVLKSGTSQGALKLEQEPPEMQPVETDLPLDAKHAATACGKVLKLDKAAFIKLKIITRLSQLVDDSGFSDEDIKEQGQDLEKQAFSAYSLAYLTWDKPEKVSRASLDKMVIDAVHSVDLTQLSSDDRVRLDAYMVKFKRMMLKAFDLGRHDAKLSPCPF